LRGKRALTQRESELERYARATWDCFASLLVVESALPADAIGGDLRPDTRTRYTSPTNIAMYLWATLAARDLQIIAADRAEQRLEETLQSVSALERHEPSGQFYNWYDAVTRAKLTRWPEPPNAPVYPFASSVDNGWLASALMMVANAVPALATRASRLAESMNFGSYYDRDAKGTGPGLLRGGFWCLGAQPPGTARMPRGDYSGLGETVAYTGHHYGAFNSESRIASYLGIALGQLPLEHYFAPWRTIPEGLPGFPQRALPVGKWRTYLGVDVFEGAYEQAGRLVLPSWGGSMFEALMPTLVVPETHWGARSWAVTHPLYVAAQIDFGLEEAGYGYWGFSPASAPDGGYREYGVPALGMAPHSYAADAVVTPHAVFLALDLAPEAALLNLAALARDFPTSYGPGGFKDSVNVATGRVAERYLALDQGMILAAIVNELLDHRLQSYLAGALQASLEPLMALEEFGARA
jgi:hypothetical protein